MAGGGAAARRALKRLSEPDAVLAITDASGAAYGVFPSGDRRRRPLGRLKKTDVARLCSDGALIGDDEVGYRLTPAGVARVQREGNEGPEAFRGQHQDIGAKAVMDNDGDIVQKTANLAESPLAWLVRRGAPDGGAFLAPHEFAAGERLRADYERSTLTARVTMRWEDTPRAPGRREYDPPAAAFSATNRINRALAEVGPGLDRVLRAVCCEGRGLDAVEQGFGWPRRSAKVVLKIALNRLAAHYGLA